MPVSLIQTNFTAGELSPRLGGRVDLARYANGLSRLENMYAQPHGGATRRSGLRYLGEAMDHARTSRLVPFQFSTVQAYVLEFGHGAMRVWKDGGQVLDGATPVEIVTPYLEADLDGLQWCQSADTMYLVHPSHAVRKLTRTSHTDWTLAEVAFTNNPFDAAGKRPCCVAFFQERLCFAATDEKPQTVWMSRTGDYENFSTSDPLVDDDSCVYTLSADQVNAIRWIQPARESLLLGTTGGEWALSGGSGSGMVTPTQVLVRRETTHGCWPLKPVSVANRVLFVQRDGRRIREMAYAFESDGFSAPDLTILAEHLTAADRIRDWAFQQSPGSVVWAVLESGLLLGLTYLPEQEVVSFHRHASQGRFGSVAVIPGEAGDELWCVVTREIGGAVRRFVERMAPEFDGADTLGAFFVDSGLSLDSPLDVTAASNAGGALRLSVAGHGLAGGDEVLVSDMPQGFATLNRKKYEAANVTPDTFELLGVDADRLEFPYPGGARVRRCVETICGLDHLEGETVAVLADGAVHPERTVSGGCVTLDEPSGLVHAGLAYVSNLVTLPLDGGAHAGTAQGRIKRITSVTVRLHRTLGCRLGADEDTLETLHFRSTDMLMGVAPDLFDGDYRKVFSGGYDTRGVMLVRQDQPLPLTVLALIPEVSVYGT
jgi:hypothetical protein